MSEPLTETSERRAGGGESPQADDLPCAVARQVERVAVDAASVPGRGRERFWASGDAARLAASLGLLWGRPAALDPLPGSLA